MPPEQPQGRVELTWSNKHQRLVTFDERPPGQKYPYRWVSAADHRAAEIRLLQGVARVGDPGAENCLIRGDALHALAALATPGAGPLHLAEQVKLAYLDPPFNTGRTFEAYEDNLEKSIWLTMMRDRLRQVQRLLRPDGSVWVHCDDSMMAPLRLVMDEVFLPANFVATIVWQKRTSRENRKAIGSSHDYILLYAMNGAVEWAKVRNKLTKDGAVARNPDNDPRGSWRSVPFSAQGFRPNQMYPITTPTGVVHLPPRGRCWAAIESNYRELLAEDRIYFPRDGNGRPRVKVFGEIEGLVPASWWPASEVGTSDEAKKEILALFPDQEAFDTPKPERLMRRIIEVATNQGEWVVDCFAGSGTTAAVAHKLGRRWVVGELEPANIDRYCLPRLESVVRGEHPGGVTEAAGWEGGGGFAVLDVAPSMFEEVEGVIALADWAVGGRLGELTALQLGFTPGVDGVFCGRKGRTRLAVVDGLVNVAAAALVAEQLGEGETVLLCGTGLDPEVPAYLAAARPGSGAQLIPQVILNSYGRPRRWAPAVRAEVERPSEAAAPAAPAVAEVAAS